MDESIISIHSLTCTMWTCCGVLELWQLWMGTCFNKSNWITRTLHLLRNAVYLRLRDLRYLQSRFTSRSHHLPVGLGDRRFNSLLLSDSIQIIVILSCFGIGSSDRFGCGWKRKHLQEMTLFFSDPSITWSISHCELFFPLHSCFAAYRVLRILLCSAFCPEISYSLPTR